MSKRLIVIGVVCLTFVIVPVIGVFAAEKPIMIRYGSNFHAKHVYTNGDLEYQAKIIKETNGRVKFRNYWGNTLTSAREAYEDIAKGVVDLAYFSQSYSKNAGPIVKRTTGWYYGVTDFETNLKIFKEVHPKYPEWVAEYNRIKPLGYSVGLHYQLMSKVPIRSIADMKGLQFKGTSTYVKVLTNLGAVAQSVPMSEVYIALQKGIIDGCMAPYETLKTFRFGEVVKSVTQSPIITGAYISRGMNLDFWNKLPPDVQKVFEDNMTEWALISMKHGRGADQGGIDFAKGKGVEFFKFSKSDFDKFGEVIAQTCVDMAKNLDKRGLPGTAIYKDIRAAAKKYGF
ncbi:TRAP transporter substrate-binding protein [Thermodesulfobacteriota bacterium]